MSGSCNWCDSTSLHMFRLTLPARVVSLFPRLVLVGGGSTTSLILSAISHVMTTRCSSLCLFWCRRHTPYGNQTDYRIFELNKRLQNWTEVCKNISCTSRVSLSPMSNVPFPSSILKECDNLWWDAFTTEFFEDDAMLTITFCLEDGPKRYSKEHQLRLHTESFSAMFKCVQLTVLFCCRLLSNRPDVDSTVFPKYI